MKELSVCDNHISVADTVKTVELDMDEVLSDMDNEIVLPFISSDLKEISDFMGNDGGNITISTEDYNIQINKYPKTTDIRIAFANSTIEIIGPEANFEEKTKMAKMFIRSILKLSERGVAFSAGEETVDTGYA